MPESSNSRTVRIRRIAIGCAAILFGWLGVHKFMLGYTKEGVIMLLLSLFSFMLLMPLVWIAAVVEGIIYLRASDTEFKNRYIDNYTPFF